MIGKHIGARDTRIVLQYIYVDVPTFVYYVFTVCPRFLRPRFLIIAISYYHGGGCIHTYKKITYHVRYFFCFKGFINVGVTGGGLSLDAETHGAISCAKGSQWHLPTELYESTGLYPQASASVLLAARFR